MTTKTVSYIGGPMDGRLEVVPEGAYAIYVNIASNPPLRDTGIEIMFDAMEIIVLRIHSFEGIHWVIDKRPIKSETT